MKIFGVDHLDGACFMFRQRGWAQPPHHPLTEFIGPVMLSDLTVSCPCGDTGTVGNGKNCRNGLIKEIMKDWTKEDDETEKTAGGKIPETKEEYIEAVEKGKRSGWTGDR